MEYDKLTNIEKIELFKIADKQKYSWLQSNDKKQFDTFEKYIRSIVEHAKIIAKEL
jgi:Zn-dependent M32 family carboxypeptidase